MFPQMSPDITADIEGIVERKTPTTSLEVWSVWVEWACEGTAWRGESACLCVLIVSMTTDDRPSHELLG